MQLIRIITRIKAAWLSPMFLRAIAVAIFVVWPTATSSAAAGELSPQQALGKLIFFDARLSEPAGQACASCHSPFVGFTSPNDENNLRGAVVPGAVPGRAGSRTPPSIAYATFSPRLHRDPKDETYVGGQFRDGRAKDLADQAKSPFLNPVEMNNPDGDTVCKKVAKADYARRFAIAFNRPLDCARDGYALIAQALAAYEMSREVNPFSSKYDAWLAGKAALTQQELRGLELFRGRAKCEQCHPSKPGPGHRPPLFTDFTYDNVGAPRNPDNPFYRQNPTFNPAGGAYVDEGLGGFLKQPAQDGKFKVPTLRNVAAGGEKFTRAYLHNGALKGLKEVMAFYNRRDLEKDRWQPEEPRNVNRDELGNLKLTGAEEDDVIAFLRTLTDGWSPASDVASK